jgi:gamma-glutamyltranspeptidase / glutathione hydrolase
MQSPVCDIAARPLAGCGPARGAVATASPHATRAALEILEAGGNAVDAAVAAAWALSVCEPSGSGLGGQTILLVHLAGGTTKVIDGHSHAPAAANPNVITPAEQRAGYRSCTVPSTPATLDYAQKKYGVLPAARVLEPALRLAREGYRITPLQRRQTGWVAQQLRASSAAARLFLREGNPPAVGELFRQPELAETLRHLSDRGVEDFYCGATARRIAEDMRLNGGLLTETDLALCWLPVEREPVFIDYRGHRIITVPPPGGGLQILLALELIEALAPFDFGVKDGEWYETVALATYGALREREREPLGPEDFTPSVCKSYLGMERVCRIARELREWAAIRHEESRTEPPGDTTHLSVADRHGNVVSLTQSIQTLFGAKVAHPTLGFLYNNYLLTCPRYPHPYAFGSRSMPRSNAAPTLVFRHGGGPLLALGAAGSRRIISSIVQVLSSLVDRGLSVSEAVSAPRLHALLSGRIWIEQPAASESVMARLRARFPAVEVKRARHFKLGSVQAIHLSAGTAQGAADPRRDGTAGTEEIQ